MAESYLPNVRGDIIRPPQTHGRWEEYPILLSGLPKDLEIDEIPETTSVPSIWARALVFEEALMDTQHPQHDAIKNEWRGLMGIFCFRKCFGLKLDFANLSFNPPTDKLTNSLLIQKPDGWPDQIYLVKVDGFLMGGSSIETLFFTPPEYKCSNFVPWYKNGKLYDPLIYFRNIDFVKEKQILKMWIEKTIDHLQGNIGASVIQPFHEWLGEMANIKSDTSAYFESHDEHLPLPYDFVNTYFSWGNEKKSDFLLKVSREEKKPPIVVWERDGWDQGGRVFNSWHYVNFAGGNSVPDLSSDNKLSDGRIQYPWMRPERLFLTDKILQIPTISKNQIPVYGDNTADKFKKECLPPLKEEILKYLSPEDLRGRLNMEDAEGGGIKVTLTLPLTSGGSLNIFKTYNQDQIIKNILEPDLRPFEVWPDFIRDGWNRYYCFYGKMKNVEARPWAYNANINNYPNNSLGCVIWEISKYPEAVLFSYNGEECGEILLASPRRIQNLGKVWDVAIDLGTTNTSVFYKEGNAVRPMRFQARCVQIIETYNRETFLLNMLFFSPKDYSRGIFSTSALIFTSRNAGLDPVIHAQFPLETPQGWFSLLTQYKDKDLPFLLKEDLKWSTDQAERNCLYAYIKCLILRIAAEATDSGANQINLKWSYPSAFSDDLKLSLSQAFGNSLPNWLRGLMTVNVNPGNTESAAVCRHLCRNAIYRGMVIVDIGGGSSDIGVWQNRQIVFQTSILLAGRLLTDYIRNQEDLRKDILFNLNIPGENPLNYFAKKCAHCFNNLIIEHYDRLCTLFTTEKSLERGYQQARSIIFLIFAGITYYIGLILKDIKIPPCDIWLAGNGSKLINLVNSQAITYLARFLPEKVNINPPRDPKEEIARGLLSGLTFRATSTPKTIIGEDGYKFGGSKVEFSQDITLDNIIRDEIEAPKDYPQLSQFLKIYNECRNVLQLAPLEITNDFNLKICQEMEGRIDYLKEMAQNHIKTHNPYQGLIQPFFVEELNFIIKETFHKK